MRSIVRSRLQPALKCGRFRSAFATNCSRRPSHPQIGRCSTQSPLLLRPTSTPLLAKYMGGGPVFPSQPLSTMHRAPAAMVTKPMTDPNVEIKTPRDPNTLSNYHNYVTRHTSVDFEIDFEKKRMVGTVVLKMESLVDGDGQVDVVLDSKYIQPEHQEENSETDMTTATLTSPRSKSTIKVQSSTSVTEWNLTGARSPSRYLRLYQRARLSRLRLLSQRPTNAPPCNG
jgi:hypothetical protein